jgi:hypothetical protein
MWLIYINTTATYDFTINGTIRDMNNITLPNTDVLLQCEFSKFNGFHRIGNDGYFVFTVYSYVIPETCTLVINPLNTRLDQFKQTFTTSTSKYFSIQLNETALEYPLELCFINAKNCLITPTNCEVDSIYNVPDVNVTLTLTSTNQTVVRRAFSGDSGCVAFSNVVYGDYHITYVSDYFEGSEDTFTINEQSLLLNNGRFWKVYNLMPKYQLYALTIYVYYIDNISWYSTNFTSGSLILSGATITLYDLDNEKTISEDTTDIGGFVTFRGLPNGNYRISVTYKDYKTQTKDVILATLSPSSSTSKEYKFTFIFEQDRTKNLTNAEGDILDTITTLVPTLFGIFLLLMLMAGMNRVRNP